ncbi:calcium channel flower [Diaphorina citri]|uniref:Calcium channel flower n=1 Tax=Diaphorina citri TaxID=121845 RepID=A0A3Q0IM85_DIACI|nr:calcium channel flower [Diaphorina citri]
MASFFSADKIGSMLARPNEDPTQDDGTPWYMKYGTRGLGIFGGGISIIFGLFNCLGILLGNIDCLFGGIIQVLTGFLVLMIEAPCCCMFIDQVQMVSDIVDKRPVWNKAALYIGLPILALMMCLSLTTIAGSGLIFIAGILYGMVALGKKAPLEAMKSSIVLTTTCQSTVTIDPHRSNAVDYV